jgi:23S rRNA (guanosine2251-2'-O)-methyltransferase
MKQLRSKASIKKKFKQHLNSRNEIQLVVMLQDWNDAYNVGGMFRVADAAGVQELILTGKTPAPGDSPMIGVTSMGAHRKVPYRQIPRYEEACAKLKDEGYALVAVEVAEESIPMHEFHYPAKMCLVLGNEGAGVYGTVMRHCESSVFIPMAGKGRSVNVHVAAAVVIFDAVLRPGAVENPPKVTNQGRVSAKTVASTREE